MSDGDSKKALLDRVVEPSVKVTAGATLPTGMNVDKRKAVARQFDTEDPGYVHVWMDGNTPVDELEMAGYEQVRWPKSKTLPESVHDKVVRVRKDILCRMRREDFENPRKQGEAMSRELVEQTMQGRDVGEDIKWQPRNLVRKPRDARDIGRPVN